MLFWYEKLRVACVINHFDNIYQLQEKIGQGAFARVFKASRQFDQQIFAVKVFDKQLVMKNKNAHLHMVIFGFERPTFFIFSKPFYT